MNFQNDIFQIQNDLGNVFLYAFNSRELMKNAVYADRSDRVAGKRRQKNAAQTVAERRTVASFERLYDKLAVGTVLF